MSATADPAVDISDSVSDSRVGGRRGVLLRWWLPATLLTTAALGQVYYLRALVEHPRQLAIFFYLFRVHEHAAALTWLALLSLGLVAAVALERPVATTLVTEWLYRHVRIVGLVALALMIAGTQLVYRAFPLSMDEYAAVFQAKAFAAGELTGRFPPGAAAAFVPAFFLDHFFYAGDDGRIVAAYLPTFALLLSILVPVGATWLLNPLLTAGSFWWIVYLARRLCGTTSAGGWAALLCLASPVLWINGVSYYAMPAHLFFNLTFAGILLEPRGWRLPLAGLVGSLALTVHQPVPHLLFAAPWGIWLLSGKGGVARILKVGLGYLPLSLLLGFGWIALRADVRTGSATSLIESLRKEPAPEVSEAAAGSNSVVHGARPERVVPLYLEAPTRSLLWVRVFNTSKEWLWTAPGLLLLALFGTIAAWRRRTGAPGRTYLLLFAASAATTFAGYLFVPFDQGHGWGYRYVFPPWAALPLLAATWLDAPAQRVRPRMLAAVAVAALLAIPAGNLLRARQVRSFIDTQRTQVPPLEDLPEDSRWTFFLDPLRGYYRADLLRNDPLLRDHVWMLVSKGRERDEALMRDMFPDAELFRESRGETLWRVPLAGATRPPPGP